MTTHANEQEEIARRKAPVTFRDFPTTADAELKRVIELRQEREGSR